MNFLEKYRMNKQLKKINKLAEEMKNKSDEELKRYTEDLSNKFKGGTKESDIVVESFAVAREACTRVLGMTPYDVQVLGALAINDGNIAEMKTGEGKTLTEVLPAYHNAILGRKVHIMTVNDYLAERDKSEMSRVFEFLGVTASYIYPDMPTNLKKEAYECDIVYGTNTEFGFDYLRDHLVYEPDERVQSSLDFVIIDEADSILIDEARTPLIISGKGGASGDIYVLADRVAKDLKKGKFVDSKTMAEKMSEDLAGYREEADGDFMVNPRNQAITIHDSGIAKIEKYFGIDSLASSEGITINHYVQQALKANYTMEKNVDYVVNDQEVLIVDASTGRIMDGRRFSDGLHQAIEAKEGVPIEAENTTVASITYQNFFRLYDTISGMTGTAKTDELELKQIYGTPVVVIPTNKPVIRVDHPDIAYKTINEKYEKVFDEAIEKQREGRPVLIGATSVEQSERIAAVFKRKGIRHNLLNAKNAEREADIIAQAGTSHSITIATNMAGRGTDIILGGNPEALAIRDMKKEFSDITPDVISKVTSLNEIEEELEACRIFFNKRKEHYKTKCDKDADFVKEAGGLHVIGTERHDSVRVDNQLRGRAGRQGDPGSSVFILSLEDDLIERFSDGFEVPVELERGTPLKLPKLSFLNIFEKAQKSVESTNFETRKTILDYDLVDHEQRSYIYSLRDEVFYSDNMDEILEKLIVEMSSNLINEFTYPEEDLVNLVDLSDFVNGIIGDYNETVSDYYKMDNVIFESFETIQDDVHKTISDMYTNKVKHFKEDIEVNGETIPDGALQKQSVLMAVDKVWSEYLTDLTNLKDSSKAAVYGSIKPINNYISESEYMFDELLAALPKLAVINYLSVKVVV